MIMKNIYILLLVAIALFSCYDDKGNDDYKELEEVEVVLPDETYNRSFGEKLQITPTVTTSIPENDLMFDWEFYGSLGNWWSKYVSVYQGKVMDFTCVQDDTLLKNDGTYKLRLNVTQQSTGRHFYSNVVSVNLVSQVSQLGALVLHGDGTSSDMGVIVAEEFQLTASSSSIVAQVFPNCYSNANGGERIAGKGVWNVQVYPSYGSDAPDNIVLIAVTDQGSAVVNSKTFSRIGEWNDLFYKGLNDGVPQACWNDDYNVYAFDGGDIFQKSYGKSTFTIPSLSGDEYGYELYPLLYRSSGSSSIQGVLFDQKSRGFIAIGQIYDFTRLAPIDVNSDEEETVSAPFNPANMQADLIHMDEGGASGRVLAVMKRDNGEYFMAELDFKASGYSKVPKYIYELNHLDDVKNGEVIDWAFGSSYINMCYYATADGVYRFSADAGKTVTPEALMTVDNTRIQFDGTITLMKILKPVVGKGYYLSNVEMVVGTYGGTAGSGKLYSMEIDPFSGRVQTMNTYTGFDQIYDVSIKGW